jgi:hypothetical protein
MSKKYNEFRVLYYDTKLNEVVKKELTDRGHVMISEYEATIMNADVNKTKLFYELHEEEPVVKPLEKMNKKELLAKAKEVGAEIDEEATKSVIAQLIKTKILEGEQ